MSRWEKFKKFLKNPGCWLWAFYAALALFVAADIVLAVFTGGANAVCYTFYFLTLITAVYCICAGVRPARAAFARMVNSNRILARMAEDYGYRTVAFSVISLAINGAYAIVQAVIGIVWSSAWYGLFSGYYMVLCLVRGAIIFGAHRIGHRDVGLAAQQGRLKLYCGCGALFMLLGVAFASLAGVLVFRETNVRGGLYGVIMMAAYAFYKIIVSAISMARVRKLHDYSVQALKNINFADALVSIFALQVTMLATLSAGDNPDYMTGMNIITGAAVFLATIGMGIYMIVRALKELHKFKHAGTAKNGVRQAAEASGGIVENKTAEGKDA